MEPFFLAVAAFGALLVADEAWACGISVPRSFLHATPPQLHPTDVIIAEVEFDEADLVSLSRDGPRVRVRRMLVGENVPVLIVRYEASTSCDVLYADRRSGFIVGQLVGNVNGIPIVTPILAAAPPAIRYPLMPEVAPAPTRGIEPAPRP